jgi:hypothetical protein
MMVAAILGAEDAPYGCPGTSETPVPPIFFIIYG